MSRLWFGLSLWTMVVFGAYDILRGVAAPLMQSDWHVSYEQLGNAFAAGSAGYLLGTFITGLVIHRLGLRTVIVGGAAVLAAATAGLVLSSSYVWVLLSLFLSGLGGGGLEIGVNTVVPCISRGAEDQSRYFNWLHGAYGLGAFLFPLISALWLKMPGGWRYLYAALGAAVLLTLAVAGATRPTLSIGTEETKAGPERARTRRLWTDRALYGLLVAIMAYVMAEVGLATWLTTYLLRVRGVALTDGSYILSGFYLLFTAGRLTAPWWVNRAGHQRSVVMALTLSCIAFAWVLCPLPGAAVALWLTGLGFSVVFPTITAIASDMFHHDAGRVLGLLFSFAGVGSLVTNALIGAVATRWGVRPGFSLILVYVLMVLAALAFTAWSRRSTSVMMKLEPPSVEGER